MPGCRSRAPGRRGRPPHHDDGDSGLAGGGQLGCGGSAPAVLRDEYVDGGAAQQLPLPFEGEGPAVEHHLHPCRAGRLGCVHGPHEEPQLVETGEGGEPHASGGEEDAAAQRGKQRGRRVEGVRRVPAVAFAGDPAGPAQREQGNMGCGRCRGGIETDGPGERVGGVDERVHLVRTQPLGEPLGPAEPADADLPVRHPGRGDPPRERTGHAQPGDLGAVQQPRQPTGLARTPQNQDVHRIGFRS